MSSFDTASPRQSFQVKQNGNSVRMNALRSGTLYAVLMRGAYGSRFTSVLQPSTAGSGTSLLPFASLPVTTQATITALQTEMGINYPNGYFIAGSNANTTRNVPTWFVDKPSSTDNTAVVRVAVPNFNITVLPTYLAGIRMRISNDLGVSYGPNQDVLAPFPDGSMYAKFNVPVPYSTTVTAQFQAIYKDGTLGQLSRPVQFFGVPQPAAPPLVAPIVGTITGVYSYSPQNNKLQLSVSVPMTPDPASGSAFVQLVDGTGTARAFNEVPNSTPGVAYTVVVSDVDPSVATYTVNAYSKTAGKLSTPTSTSWNTSSATSYLPPKFDPTKIVLSEEIYRMADGTAQSKLRVNFLLALDAERASGAVWIRERDTYGGDLNSFGGFVQVGIATGNFLTDSIAFGATVVWDVVVLAVGKNGAQAAFSSDQIKSLAIVQYANMVPAMQALPVVTMIGENSIIITGTYSRPVGNPEPTKIRAYASETSTTTVITDAVYQNMGSNNYAYSLTISDLSPYSVGSNNYDITLRTVLENGNSTATASKTTVRVTRGIPAAPTLSSAAAFVSTVQALIAGAGTLSSTGQSTYTPGGGGNGTTISITPAKGTLIAEMSDGVTLGLNPENILNVNFDTTLNVATFTPTTNTGTKNVRFKWRTTFGDSAFSNAKTVTFASSTAVDTTVPVVAAVCYPFFYPNSDGSITLTWTGATFGSSGLGNYVIRRNSSNSVSTSLSVGTVTTTTGTLYTWTDFLDSSRVGQSFYYWLEAVSAQGVKSAAPIPVVLQPASTYPTTAPTPAAAYGAAPSPPTATSVDAAPATPTGLTALGAQGGFGISWNPNAERDLKNYFLDWSANGAFTDTVTYTISGTSYFQTAGAQATSAVAGVYKWRLRAGDFGGNASANCTAVTANLTNYGSIQDTQPANLTSASAVANTDGSVTITIANPADTARAYYEILRRSKSVTFADGDGGVTLEATLLLPSDGTLNAATWTDTGLNPNKFYSYRVYGRSKLGTSLSAAYVSTTAVQAQYVIQGVNRPSLIFNGHFGTANGGYGTSTSGWTLGSGVSFVSASGNITIGSTNFATPQFIKTGVTAFAFVTQNFQVIPGRKYTVMGVIYYSAITQDGRAYIRVASAGTLSDASGGATTAPSPYNTFPAETSGIDYTTVSRGYRFISYSFIAPATVNQMTLQVGFENRTATDQAFVCPAFIQVFQDQ